MSQKNTAARPKASEDLSPSDCRPSLAIAVSMRIQTPEQGRQWNDALHQLLSELVRQQLAGVTGERTCRTEI